MYHKKQKKKPKQKPSLPSSLEYSVVLVGDGAVGKSSITARFISGEFIDEYDPTIENSFRRHVIVDDVACMLDILDTAGQEEYSAMREQYMRNTRGFMLVYDVTNSASLYKLCELYRQIIQVKDTKTVPIVFVGNKCDLVDLRMNSSDGVPNGLAHEILRDEFQINSPIHIECSALSNQGVSEAFREIIREIRKYNPGIGAPSYNKGSSCIIL